jgi:3-oxoacyl-[acyl-carrier-protein] synthase II
MEGRRKVVITGIGPVTPVGIGVDDFWHGLTSGRNGIRTITRFPLGDLPVTLAGEVDGFEPRDHLDAKEARRTDRFTQFGIAAAKLAWADAGEPDVVSERGGVIFATGIGGIETLLTQYDVLQSRGPGRVSPFMVPMLMANAPAGHVAMTFGLTGANLATISACSSSNHAIWEAMRLLRDGTLDLCIAGGSESATLPITVAAFSQMTALTKNPDPEFASRPFDADRDGFVLSEGACALIMETEEHANARGARIYCEVAGAGASDDAFHITAPDPKGSGATLAMRWALQDAGAEPHEVDYINAHGTSTMLNDASEAAAIANVLGEHARTVAVSSTKSMTGHQMGAAGAVEGAACALAITHGLIPPTIHHRTPDPDLTRDVTPSRARELEVKLALSNSFGFGGHNTCVAFRATV